MGRVRPPGEAWSAPSRSAPPTPGAWQGREDGTVASPVAAAPRAAPGRGARFVGMSGRRRGRRRSRCCGSGRRHPPPRFYKRGLCPRLHSETMVVSLSRRLMSTPALHSKTKPNERDSNSRNAFKAGKISTPRTEPGGGRLRSGVTGGTWAVTDAGSAAARPRPFPMPLAFPLPPHPSWGRGGTWTATAHRQAPLRTVGPSSEGDRFCLVRLSRPACCEGRRQAHTLRWPC